MDACILEGNEPYPCKCASHPPGDFTSWACVPGSLSEGHRGCEGIHGSAVCEREREH